MSNQEEQSQRKLSVAETIAQLVASGAKLGQKTGAILMPVSKGYREAVERERLKKAYLNTTYRVYEPAIDIRVDKENHGLAATLQQIGHTQWAYLTAWNPFSKQLSREENDARNKSLSEDLKPFRVYEGEGVGDDSSWPPEKSFLVAGIHREVAIYLGKKYEQNAIVVGQGARAELVMLT
jgi:hypothetical protein